MSILADFLSDSDNYYDDNTKELELVSLESDYLELCDISVEMCQYQSSIEQIDHISNGVCDLYDSMEALRDTDNVCANDLIIISKGVNSLIEPINLKLEMPSFESNEQYIDRYRIDIGIEGVSDILAKIKEFILKLYNGFINSMKKFFDWVKGLFGKTKKNAEVAEKKIKQKKEKKDAFKETEIDFKGAIKSGYENDMDYIGKIIGNTFKIVEVLLTTKMLWDTDGGKKISSSLDLVSDLDHDTATADQVKSKINEFLKLVSDAYIEHSESVNLKPDNTKTKDNVTTKFYKDILGNGVITCTCPSSFTPIAEKDKWKESANKMVTEQFNPSGWKWIKLSADTNVKSKPTIIKPKDLYTFLVLMEQLCQKAKKLDIEKYTKLTDDALAKAKKDFDKSISSADKTDKKGKTTVVTDAIRFISTTCYQFVTSGSNSSNQIVKGYLPVLNEAFRVIDEATK